MRDKVKEAFGSCIGCGKKTNLYNYTVCGFGPTPQRYCSSVCATKQLKCTGCKMALKTAIFRFKHKKRISPYANKYCTEKCANTHRAKVSKAAAEGLRLQEERRDKKRLLLSQEIEQRRIAEKLEKDLKDVNFLSALSEIK